MSANAFESGLLEDNDTYNRFARFWPPMEPEGNPFLALADPDYTGRILCERAPSLLGLAVSQRHKMAEPPESY